MAGRYQGCHMFRDMDSQDCVNVEVLWQNSGWFWRRLEDDQPHDNAVGPFTTSSEAYGSAKAELQSVRPFSR
jgi:hypothetical protein